MYHIYIHWRGHIFCYFHFYLLLHLLTIWNIFILMLLKHFKKSSVASEPLYTVDFTQSWIFFISWLLSSFHGSWISYLVPGIRCYILLMVFSTSYFVANTYVQPDSVLSTVVSLFSLWIKPSFLWNTQIMPGKLPIFVGFDLSFKPFCKWSWWAYSFLLCAFTVLCSQVWCARQLRCSYPFGVNLLP